MIFSEINYYGRGVEGWELSPVLTVKNFRQNRFGMNQILDVRLPDPLVEIILEYAEDPMEQQLCDLGRLEPFQFWLRLITNDIVKSHCSNFEISKFVDDTSRYLSGYGISLTRREIQWVRNVILEAGDLDDRTMAQVNRFNMVRKIAMKFFQS